MNDLRFRPDNEVIDVLQLLDGTSNRSLPQAVDLIGIEDRSRTGKQAAPTFVFIVLVGLDLDLLVENRRRLEGRSAAAA